MTEESQQGAGVRRRDRRERRGRSDRTDHVVGCLEEAFAPLMEAAPDALRTKFRKMARDPFAFYRGSAPLFYADVATGDVGAADERWCAGGADRVWIHGDLHAENFGTYMDADGRLVFDVNDFDEAYVGPWTWDLRRFVASLALLCWEKALPDDAIDTLVDVYVRSYLDQVQHYTSTSDDTEWAITLDSAEGAVLDALRAAKSSRRADLLDRVTAVEDHRRRFAAGAGVRPLEDDERAAVVDAFERYLATIPESKQDSSVRFDPLDVVGRSGFGIGSAGLPAYNVLVEGTSQAIDNDVVLSMKQGNEAAPGRVVRDESVRSYFDHHGHRTALSQRALQAHADRYLGWTELDGTGFVVAELSPYEQDLEWDETSEPEDLEVVVRQLGRATAKVHCVADSDSDHELVTASVEHLVSEAVGDDADTLVADLRDFAHGYAERVRDDHRLFVDAFRQGAFARLRPH